MYKEITTNSVETTQRIMLEISREDIVEYCSSKGIDVPEEAEIYFAVPADGYGTNVDVTKRYPVRVRWAEPAA